MQIPITPIARIVSRNSKIRFSILPWAKLYIIRATPIHVATPTTKAHFPKPTF